MANRKRILNRFLTNNHRYQKDDPDYGKAYLLNAVLSSMVIFCMVFAILNIVKTKYPMFIFCHLLISVLSVVVIIFFHKTDKLHLCSIFAVILTTFLMASFTYLVKNDHFGLFWFSVYPPFVYFILGRKKGRIATFSLGIAILLYIIFSHKNWEPAAFDYISIINIAGASISLVLLIVFYEKSKMQAEESLVSKNKQLYVMSITDRLTNLYNRYKLDETLNEYINPEKNCEQHISIIIADIDQFKSVNDTFGHLTGDKVLIDVSNILLSSVRDQDIVGRWGGEEFLIICPNTDYMDIIRIAEKIAHNISLYRFGNGNSISLSFGIATCRKDETVDDLLQRADQYMYLSKEEHRRG